LNFENWQRPIAKGGTSRGPLFLQSLDQLDAIDHIVRNKRAELLQTPVMAKVVETFWKEFGETVYKQQVLVAIVFILSLALTALSDINAVVLVAAVALLACLGYYLNREIREHRKRGLVLSDVWGNLANLMDAAKVVAAAVGVGWRLELLLSESVTSPSELPVTLKLVQACAAMFHSHELVELAKIPRSTGPLIVMVVRMINDFSQVGAFFMLFYVTFGTALSIVASSKLSAYNIFSELALIVMGDSSAEGVTAYDNLDIVEMVAARTLFVACKKLTSIFFFSLDAF
jgi:hypothetical protein